MDNERPDVHPPRYVASMRPSRGRETSRPALSGWRLGAVVLLGVLASVPALAQPTALAAPRPLNPVLSGTGGSCGTQFAPCPAISRLGLFVWLSGQYLGTGLGGNPHASTLGGSVDIAMEVASRVAVSASLPGALSRIQGQYGEEIWVIGGPLEARARVRLGTSTQTHWPDSASHPNSKVCDSTMTTVQDTLRSGIGFRHFMRAWAHKIINAECSRGWGEITPRIHAGLRACP